MTVVFMAFYCILPKLFTNSLLASLNERSYTRREFSNLSYGIRSTGSRSAGEPRITIERVRPDASSLFVVTLTMAMTPSRQRSQWRTAKLSSGISVRRSLNTR